MGGSLPSVGPRSIARRKAPRDRAPRTRRLKLARVSAHSGGDRCRVNLRAAYPEPWRHLRTIGERRISCACMRYRPPNPINPANVLGAIKVWPGMAGARGEVGATANLDSPCARRPAENMGWGEGTGFQVEQRNCEEGRKEEKPEGKKRSEPAARALDTTTHHQRTDREPQPERFTSGSLL